MFFDSFLKLANISKSDAAKELEKFDALGKKYNIDLCIALSAEESDIPESLRSSIIS